MLFNNIIIIKKSINLILLNLNYFLNFISLENFFELKIMLLKITKIKFTYNTLNCKLLI